MTAARYYPSSLVAVCIEMYQRFLSPYKGFRCAYRARTKRASCSEFAKRVALRRGVAALPALLRERFKRCAVAARAMAHRRSEKGERRRGSSSSAFDGCGDAAGEACVHGGCDVLGEAACAGADGLF
jgi:putative component of membrane protein insertase Oxa1/YidC/SpoIIIJ protein YidD